MKKICIFAGSFDPFTLGHFDIVDRAAKLFDEVVVGVAEETGGKHCKISIDKRVTIVRESVKELKNVSVKPFSSFLVTFAIDEGASTIIRGLRTSNDFEYEKALTEVYKSQSTDIETVYLISSHTYCHISSTIVRELAIMGGNMTGYVHKNVEKTVSEFYKKK